MKNSNVFCSDCKWIGTSNAGFIVCREPSNLEYEYYQKYYSREKMIRFKLYPDRINKNNDCISYSRKWWKVWV